MKKETILWQVVILILGLLVIFTVKSYSQNKQEIDAEAKRAECLINAASKNLDTDIQKFCIDIDAIPNY